MSKESEGKLKPVILELLAEAFPAPIGTARLARVLGIEPKALLDDVEKLKNEGLVTTDEYSEDQLREDIRLMLTLTGLEYTNRRSKSRDMILIVAGVIIGVFAEALYAPVRALLDQKLVPWQDIAVPLIVVGLLVLVLVIYRSISRSELEYIKKIKKQ